MKTKSAKRLASISVERLAIYFAYLDQLRESGVTNMFGSASYLMNAFTMAPDTADAVVGVWMVTFSREEGSDVRAEKALSDIAA